MSGSNIHQQEHTLLCACFENLTDTFLATIAATPGDFGVVETATADLLVRLRRALVEGGLRLSCVCAPHDYVCPACGQALWSWGSRSRRVVTREGEAALRSVRYRCVDCQSDFFPLEEANGLSGSAFTTPAKGYLAEQACQDPYASVSQAAAERAIGVSAKQVDRLAQEVSAWREAEEQAVVAATYPDVSGGQAKGEGEEVARLHDFSHWPKEAQVLLCVDGAKVRSPQSGPNGLEWFEDRAALLAPVLGERERTGGKVYLGGVWSADTLFERLSATWVQSGLSGRRMVFAADGAEWIWERARFYFPQAVQVLDLYHAAEHVGSAAAACWGTESEQAKEWRAKAREWLLASQGVQGILGRLVEAMRSADRVADREALRREWGYLWRHRHRRRYAWLRAQGLPVGSGEMESAIKQLSVARLRQPGMMWSKRGADGMLRLRAAHLSGSLQPTIQRKHQQLQEQAKRFLKPAVQPLRLAA